MMLILLYILLSLATYLIAKHISGKIRRLPPSPFPELPILGHLHLLKKPLHRTLTRIAARHGPVVLLRFGSRPVLVVSSPSAAEECLTKNDVVFANRPHLLAGKYLGYNYTSLAWASYGHHWRNLRRIASLEILSSHRLHTLQTIRADEVLTLARRLAGEDESPPATVEMKSAFFELMLNVMMRMIAGKRYYGETVEEAEEVTAFREIVAETFRIGGATNVGEFLPFLRKVGFKGVEKELQSLHEKREKFMKKLVEEERRSEGSGCRKSGEAAAAEEGKKNKTLIQVLLGLQEAEPEYYQDVTIRSIMLVLLAAGTDTSAATMEWTMSLLLNNPEVLKKAQSEIDAVVGFDRLVNESDLGNLPYLHCIITETLRLYPVGPLLVPHESSDECRVGGYRVPASTMLLINLYAIQRDPKYWPDANEFKPERFQGMEMEGVRDAYKMMPFGSGRRGCPGENLALRMIGATIGVLVQCFDWARVSEELVDMTEGTGLTMPKLKPLLAKCTPRKTMLPLLRPN